MGLGLVVFGIALFRDYLMLDLFVLGIWKFGLDV